MLLLIIGITTAPSKRRQGRDAPAQQAGSPTVARAGCALILSLIYHRLEGCVNHNYAFLRDFFHFACTIVIMHNFVLLILCILSTMSNFEYSNCAILRNTSLFAKIRAEMLDKTCQGCIIISRQGVLDRMFFLAAMRAFD